MEEAYQNFRFDFLSESERLNMNYSNNQSNRTDVMKKYMLYMELPKIRIGDYKKSSCVCGITIRFHFLLKIPIDEANTVLRMLPIKVYKAPVVNFAVIHRPFLEDKEAKGPIPKSPGVRSPLLRYDAKDDDWLDDMRTNEIADVFRSEKQLDMPLKTSQLLQPQQTQCQPQQSVQLIRTSQLQRNQPEQLSRPGQQPQSDQTQRASQLMRNQPEPQARASQQPQSDELQRASQLMRYHSDKTRPSQQLQTEQPQRASQLMRNQPEQPPRASEQPQSEQPWRASQQQQSQPMQQHIASQQSESDQSPGASQLMQNHSDYTRASQQSESGQPQRASQLLRNQTEQPLKPSQHPQSDQPAQRTSQIQQPQQSQRVSPLRPSQQRQSANPSSDYARLTAHNEREESKQFEVELSSVLLPEPLVQPQRPSQQLQSEQPTRPSQQLQFEQPPRPSQQPQSDQLAQRTRQLQQPQQSQRSSQLFLSQQRQSANPSTEETRLSPYTESDEGKQSEVVSQSMQPPEPLLWPARLLSDDDLTAHTDASAASVPKQRRPRKYFVYCEIPKVLIGDYRNSSVTSSEIIHTHFLLKIARDEEFGQPILQPIRRYRKAKVNFAIIHRSLIVDDEAIGPIPCSPLVKSPMIKQDDEPLKDNGFEIPPNRGKPRDETLHATMGFCYGRLPRSKYELLSQWSMVPNASGMLYPELVLSKAEA